jgi:hypothetical protein
MPRPCGHRPATPTVCYLCWLAVHHPAYREKFAFPDELPLPLRPPPTPSVPIHAEGEQTVRIMAPEVPVEIRWPRKLARALYRNLLRRACNSRHRAARIFLRDDGRFGVCSGP